MSPPFPRASRLSRHAVVLAALCSAVLVAGCDPPAADAARDTTVLNQARPAVATGVVQRFDTDVPGAGDALPADIARALSSDVRVLDCPAGTRDGTSAFAADWVVARRVDLDDDGRDDWVVQGRHACLAADGDADWWLYADDGAQRRLLLDAGRARALEVLDASTGGFHDLRLHRENGVIEASYRDGAYVVPARVAGVAWGDDAPSLAAEHVAVPLRGGETTVRTAAGLLRIAPLGGAADVDAHVMQLGGQELLRTGTGGEFGDFPLPLVLARYRGLAPFDDVLVIQQHMYGNACNGGPLWILGLRKGDRPVRTATIDYCGGGDPVLEASATALSITLPGAPASVRHGGAAPQRWELRDGKLQRLDPP